MSRKGRLTNIRDLLDDDGVEKTSQGNRENAASSQPRPTQNLSSYQHGSARDHGLQRSSSHTLGRRRGGGVSTSKHPSHQRTRMLTIQELLSPDVSAFPEDFASTPHLQRTQGPSEIEPEGGSTNRLSRSRSSKGGFPCPQCRRLFSRRSDVSKHIRVVHERLKVFECSICGKGFARKDYLAVSCPFIWNLRITQVSTKHFYLTAIFFLN